MINLMKNGEVIGQFSVGAVVFLPNGDVVSPAYSGWEGSDGYSFVDAEAPPPPTQEEILAAARSTMSLSFAQLLIGLVAEGWVTEAEGEAWLTGTLPTPVLALIDTLPTEQQFAAKARALRPSEVLRNDSLVQTLGSAQGKTPEELDTFFQTYSQV